MKQLRNEVEEWRYLDSGSRNFLWFAQTFFASLEALTDHNRLLLPSMHDFILTVTASPTRKLLSSKPLIRRTLEDSS